MPFQSHPNQTPDFRQAARVLVAGSGLLILLPFAINNAIQGRWMLAVGSTSIVILLAAAVWGARKGKRWGQLAISWVAPVILGYLVLAILRQGIIGMLWCFPSAIGFCLMFQGRHAHVLNATLIGLSGWAAFQMVDTAVWSRFVISLTAVVVFTSLVVRVIEKQRGVLEELARIDPLTRLNNRSQLRERLNQAVSHARGEAQPVTALMVDIDRFKDINDTLGHAQGDLVLQRVAELLAQHTRTGDHCFRMGGEEFLVVLEGCDQSAAHERAESLRASIERASILDQGPVTVSIGVAQFDVQETAATWLKRADARMYEAKQAGRNRVVV